MEVGFHFPFSFLCLYSPGILLCDERSLLDIILALQGPIFYLNKSENTHETFRGQFPTKLWNWAGKDILSLDPLSVSKSRSRKWGELQSSRKLKKWKQVWRQVFPGRLELILTGMEGVAWTSGNNPDQKARLWEPVKHQARELSPGATMCWWWSRLGWQQWKRKRKEGKTLRDILKEEIKCGKDWHKKMLRGKNS